MQGNPYPCQKREFNWNDKGLHSVDLDSNRCLGIDSAIEKRYISAHYHPAVFKSMVKDSNLHSQFSLTRGIPSSRQNIKIN